MRGEFYTRGQRISLVRTWVARYKVKLRHVLSDVLGTLGLLPMMRIIKRRVVSLISPDGGHQAIMDEADRRRLMALRHHYADTFSCISSEVGSSAKRVLVIVGAVHRIEMELCLAKALEMAGAVVVPMIRRDLLSESYALLQRAEVHFWEVFYDKKPFLNRAETFVQNCGSLTELNDLTFAGARVGGHAVASLRRGLKSGSLDLQTPALRAKLVGALAASMASAEAVRRIIQELRPSLVLTDDTAYTPRGTFLDICVESNIPVVRWYPAHKNDALILKRYSAANRDDDLNSLSDESWQAVIKMPWSEDRRAELKRELNACYARGDWYGLVGTQFGKRLLDPDAVRRKLRLDPSKRTGFIFPHIGWDASFSRGRDLFESYDEWLVETVRAACVNDKLQWVVKIHPSHVVKSFYERRPAEEEIIRRRIGQLPPHVSLLGAGSDISTLSLFPVMDYCLTVRGTSGLEAACLGIPVLTGGTGRYDRKGFTIDTMTPGQYLDRIAHIEDIPRLTSAQIELAQRYAYGLFLLRPLPLSSVTMKYHEKYGMDGSFSWLQINLRTREDWERAADLHAFADWALNSDEEDFLLAIPFQRSERQGQRGWVEAYVQ